MVVSNGQYIVHKSFFNLNICFAYQMYTIHSQFFLIHKTFFTIGKDFHVDN
jgi:hypothetical protein